MTWLKSIRADEEAAWQTAKLEAEEELAAMVDASHRDPPQIPSLKQRPKRIPMEQYVEKWRVLLWEKAFGSFFSGPSQYSKSHPFSAQSGTDMAWKRLLYRYFKRELIPKGVVDDIPAPWHSWLETSGSDFIYTINQRKNFNLGHLKEGCWYLECPKTMVTAEEKEVKEEHTKKKDGDDEQGDDADDVLPSVDAEPEQATQAVSTSTQAEDGTTKKRKRGGLSKTAAKDSSKESAQKRKGGKKSDQFKVEASRSETVNASPSLERADKPLVSLASTVARVHERFVNDSVSSWVKQNVDMAPEGMPEAYHDVFDWVKSITPGRPRSFNGVVDRASGYADLIIADVPEGLCVPGVSVPAHEVPSWNTREESFLAGVFSLASSLLHDNAALVIIHSDDNGYWTGEIKEWSNEFGFTVFKSWFGYNRLRLASAKKSGGTTNLFRIVLLSRSKHSKFSFRPSPSEYSRIGIDIAEDDVIQNWTTTGSQIMCNQAPWRGAREKDPLFMECLIRATTDEGDVVIDLAAATGTYLITTVS